MHIVVFRASQTKITPQQNFSVRSGHIASISVRVAWSGELRQREGAMQQGGSWEAQPMWTLVDYVHKC